MQPAAAEPLTWIRDGVEAKHESDSCQGNRAQCTRGLKQEPAEQSGLCDVAQVACSVAAAVRPTPSREDPGIAYSRAAVAPTRMTDQGSGRPQSSVPDLRPSVSGSTAA